MTKLLVLSDSGVPSGYGRITDEIMTRLYRRGYEIISASLQYDGLLPPVYEGQRLPYWVPSLGGHPNWPDQFMALLGSMQSDVVMVIQDAPYAETVRNAPIDWSRYGFVVITPVDGAPVFKPWIEMLKQADGVLSISQFGVDTHRRAGVHSELCRPGVNLDSFYPTAEGNRLDTRQKLGIEADAFVLMTCAMNQGRKCWPVMLEGFFKFAADKPNARYIINTDPQSPAGWDFSQMCRMFGWDESKLIYKSQCEKRGVFELRDRYNAADAHVVLAHREGYGLPLTESMACGVATMALDYCSGTEVCGDGKGVLINPLPYKSISTWGNALDYHPDIDHYVNRLQWLYDNPDERRAIGKRGMEWARGETWDKATDSVMMVVERVMSKRKSIPLPNVAPMQMIVKPVVSHPDGLQPVELVEKVV